MLAKVRKSSGGAGVVRSLVSVPMLARSTQGVGERRDDGGHARLAVGAGDPDQRRLGLGVTGDRGAGVREQRGQLRRRHDDDRRVECTATSPTTHTAPRATASRGVGDSVCLVPGMAKKSEPGTHTRESIST